MSADAQETSQFLALADLVERWAADLPRWDGQAAEPWYEFCERSYQAEMALAARLRRLPTCLLSMCSLRQHISMTLAGVSVRSDKSLAQACLNWARAVRARVSAPANAELTGAYVNRMGC